MRDVEAVEMLSTQLLISTLNIALNISVALAVTISKSLVVFLFFLVTTPLAGTYNGIFQEYNEKA